MVEQRDLRFSTLVSSLNFSVRRGKALIHSGWKSRPGAGSFHPVAIGAVVEATKLLKPPVQKVA